jgi:Flp pilus assembly protein TadD
VDRGEFDRAIALYRTALALDPTQPDFYDNIGLAYRVRARTPVQGGD